mmetsp:Transcript_27031/g.69446  ORF Transcript_27031/g.69446 Transcript_27031/m.69446 type:complete len:82 (+) Transcript_27031:278-523(+)
MLCRPRADCCPLSGDTCMGESPSAGSAPPPPLPPAARGVNMDTDESWPGPRKDEDATDAAPVADRAMKLDPCAAAEIVAGE